MVEEVFKEFRKKRAETIKQPEIGEINPEKEREILREVISEQIRKTRSIPASQQQIIMQKTQQIKDQPKERQIKLLIDLAFEKGVFAAIEVAKSLDNPYLIDELHDVLADELYNKLVEQEKLEKI